MRKGKLGRGSAVLEGFKHAQKIPGIEYILEMDADFSHDPAEIVRLTEKAAPDRVIIGSRYVPGSRIINWPMKRKILSTLSNIYERVVLGIPINDYTNGFRYYPVTAVRQLISSKLHESGYAQLSESAYTLYKRGYSFIEVPTTFVNRKRGKSNTNWREYFRTLTAIFRIRFSA